MLTAVGGPTALTQITKSYNLSHMTLVGYSMSDAELLIVLGAASVLIVATFFSSLRRKRRDTTDYWLPDGSRIRRPKADRP